MGGYVCYTACAKNAMLNVDFDLINDFGTISAEVTEALLEGLKEHGADIGLAITGVAGEKIEGKPPGHMYIGIGTHSNNKISHFQFNGTRTERKMQAVEKGFELLIEELEK